MGLAKHKLNFGRAIFLALLFVPAISMARRPVVKNKLPNELKVELNAVLKAAVDLQESSFKRSDQQTQQNIKKLLQKIGTAEKKASLAKTQRIHLFKMLDAARGALEKSRRTAGADRHTFMQAAFRQIVGLAQSFQLDTYKIFFCPKDKSTWLQRGAKPQNPVNPETQGSCGKPVL